MFSRSHSPPPSATGSTWSASHRLRRVTRRNPQWASNSTRERPRERSSLRQACSVSTAQLAQTPLSRCFTWSRRYPGLERSRHSCTQSSEQKVRRRRGTCSPHHRQSMCPSGPLGSFAHCAAPPGIVRCVLIPAQNAGRPRPPASANSAPGAPAHQHGYEQFVAARCEVSIGCPSDRELGSWVCEDSEFQESRWTTTSMPD
jgi:hypothetical protein